MKKAWWPMFFGTKTNFELFLNLRVLQNYEHTHREHTYHEHAHHVKHTHPSWTHPCKPFFVFAFRLHCTNMYLQIKTNRLWLNCLLQVLLQRAVLFVIKICNIHMHTVYMCICTHDKREVLLRCPWSRIPTAVFLRHKLI